MVIHSFVLVSSIHIRLIFVVSIHSKQSLNKHLWNARVDFCFATFQCAFWNYHEISILAWSGNKSGLVHLNIFLWFSINFLLLYSKQLQRNCKEAIEVVRCPEGEAYMQSCTERHRGKSEALLCFVYTTPLSQEFTIAISCISSEQICTLLYALGVSWFIKLMIGDPQPSKQLTNNLFSYTPCSCQCSQVRFGDYRG